MTKKHYEAIASAIKTSHNLETATKKLADYFSTDNPKFDRTRFLQACGIETK